MSHDTASAWYKEPKMIRRIVIGIIAVGAIALCVLAYRNWQAKRAMLSGDVYGDAGQSAQDAPQRPEPSTTRPIASPSANAGTAEAVRQPAGIPATDSIDANPPNGAKFAGTGRYQVYRQGNLTWRLNTDTGQACVLFATEEEWRKPKVFQQGCGNSAAQ